MVRTMLRVEGFAELLVSCLAIYFFFDGCWWIYLVLLFGPDIGMVGFAINKGVGTYMYNFLHTKITGFALLVSGLIFDCQDLQVAGIVIIGHSGMDRMLGLGLKYESGFFDTHLQRV